MPGTPMICGITGSRGFIGSHLMRCLHARQIACVEIGRDDFGDDARLREKVSRCDAVIHFAGLSRHGDGEYLYRVNRTLGEKLVAAVHASPAKKPKLFLASTTHIGRDTWYHKSKRDVAELFESNVGGSVILLMPNTFGPGGKVFYNSVVSTFCFLSAAGKTPERIDDAALDLIYVDDLVEKIADLLLDGNTSGTIRIADQYHENLPRLWQTLCGLADGNAPQSDFERDLAQTRQSYCAQLAGKNAETH